MPKKNQKKFTTSIYHTQPMNYLPQYIKAIRTELYSKYED